MSELRQLYQEVILDHHKQPRNYGAMANPTRQAHGHNPLCGDDITVYIRLEGDVVADVRFEGTGCAISQASASMMTAAIKGKSRQDVESLFGDFHRLVAEDGAGPAREDRLGKLVVFAGVKEFPMRVKCATLAWHTLLAAVKQSEDVVTTE